LVPDAAGEGGTVGGVAHRAREDGDGPVHAALVDGAAVVAQDGDDALDRLGRERAGGVDALAEAGDDGAAVALDDRAVGGDVSDQQAGRVRAQVDDRDPRGPLRRAQRSSGSPVIPVSSSAVGPSPGANGAESGPPGTPSPAPPATPEPPS